MGCAGSQVHCRGRIHSTRYSFVVFIAVGSDNQISNIGTILSLRNHLWYLFKISEFRGSQLCVGKLIATFHILLSKNMPLERSLQMRFQHCGKDFLRHIPLLMVQ
jgi:hypothetical protein